jgi:3-hydroxyacyl-[acyl-carrier-protein] dehydratase
MKLPLSSVDIQQIIPHRYPMLLVDRVIEFSDAEKIVGIKNVSANESFFQGHFPNQPIMPGVLMLEALAQLGVLFAKLTTGGVPIDSLTVFAGVEEVRFRRQVVPGDQLRLEMSLIKRRRGLWKMQGLASVNGEVAVEGILTAAEIFE